MLVRNLRLMPDQPVPMHIANDQSRELPAGIYRASVEILGSWGHWYTVHRVVDGPTASRLRVLDPLRFVRALLNEPDLDSVTLDYLSHLESL